MIRNKKVVKAIVVFLLVIFLNTLFFPTISLALTSGDSQPEFSSYQSTDATDMVNLLTGNFSYTIPLINVPGPEGSFSMPLFYNAGIGPEQEASWVGLGWNINAGSIARNINQFPDDAWGNFNPGSLGQSNDVYHLYYSQSNVEADFEKDYFFYERNYSSETGYGGGISLLNIVNVNWGKGQGGANILGAVGYSQKGGIQDFGLHIKGGKVTISFDDEMSSIMNVASFILSLGSASLLEGAAIKAAEVGKFALEGAVSGFVISKLMSLGQGNSNSYSNISDHRRSSFWGVNNQYYVSDDWYEEMYGSLYLGEMANSKVSPTNATNIAREYNGDCAAPLLRNTTAPAYYDNVSGESQPFVIHNAFNSEGWGVINDFGVVASDMSVYVDPQNNSEIYPYADNFHPTSIAYDNYSVMGPGVSGNIQPYRLETGTLSYTNQASPRQQSYNLIPFQPTSAYKVNFIYKGEFSNSYSYHKYYASQTEDYMGFTYDFPSSTVFPVTGDNISCAQYVDYTPTDPTLLSSAGQPGGQIEQARYGLNNAPGSTPRLATGKHVEWYTNYDIINSSPLNNFIDYPNFDRTQLPPKGIGGFSVTNTDGTTYHYALPVYNTVRYSNSTTSAGYSEIRQPSAYAYTWLLTGITGSDYVDSNNNGVIDNQDWGYWVAFNYGKFASDFHWRQPYWNYTALNSQNESEYSEGLRENYYLNSVQTRSHTAIFIKSIRPDGRGAYCVTGSSCSINSLNTNLDFNNSSNAQYNHNDQYPSSSLELDEVFVLSNLDYDTLQKQGLIPNSNNNPTTQTLVVNPSNPAIQKAVNGDNLNTVYDQSDITPSLRNSIYQRQLQRIIFNYAYTACPGTENSFADASNPPTGVQTAPPTGTLGKTTLNSLSITGRNNLQVLPSYVFDYNLTGDVNNTNQLINPSYTENSYDGWGMYTTDGSTNHNVSPGTTDANVWSLQQITTPMGAIIDITYERDSYNSVAGQSMQATLNITGFSITANPNIPGSTIGIITVDITPLGGEDLTNCNWSTAVPVNFNAKYIETCTESNGSGGINIYSQNSDPYTITSSQTVVAGSVTSKTFTISNPPELPNNTFLDPSTNKIVSCSIGNFTNMSGTVVVDGVPSKIGGDLRVSMLHSYDNLNGDYKTAYIYTQDGTPTGLTSGVVSIEPQYVRSADYTDETFNSYDYPNTGVLYGKVTVLNGTLTTNGVVDLTNYVGKSQYTFTTPAYTMITNKKNPAPGANLWAQTTDFGEWWQLLFGFHNVYVNTSQIGQVQSILQMDKNSNVISQSSFNYDTSSYLGVRTEGTLLCEWLQSTTNNDNAVERLIRTTKTYTPSYLQSITTTVGGITATATNNQFDFLTGEITNKGYTNSLGINYQAISVPAYQNYAGMGSKTNDPTNSNMLSALSGQYLYKVGQPGSVSFSASGSYYQATNSLLGSLPATYQVGDQITLAVSDNGQTTIGSFTSVITNISSIGFSIADKLYKIPSFSYSITAPSSTSIVSADIQTWNNTWTYRQFNSSQDSYSDVANNNSWRKQATYVWNSPLLNSDGTYYNFIDFNYSNTSALSPYWKKTSEFTSYDVYSMPLEVKDINGNYSATKMGFNQSYVLASATNSNYNSFYYSGFEDQLIDNSGNNNFGGEVTAGWTQYLATSGAVIAHTGSYVSMVQSYDGPGIRAYTNNLNANSNILTGRRYRASVWVHTTSDASAQLIATVTPANGTTTTATANFTDPSAMVIGNWKRLTLTFDVPAGYISSGYGVNVYLASNGASYFDDFIVRPINAEFTGNVYDPKTGLLMSTIDKDGFYTRYVYDTQNRITDTYKELATGEVKISHYDYNTRYQNFIIQHQ